MNNMFKIGGSERSNRTSTTEPRMRSTLPTFLDAKANPAYLYSPPQIATLLIVFVGKVRKPVLRFFDAVFDNFENSLPTIGTYFVESIFRSQEWGAAPPFKEECAVARLPLFKALSPPLTERERLRMVQEARRGLAERPGMSRAFKARGLLALHIAEERIRSGRSGRRRRKAAAGH